MAKPQATARKPPLVLLSSGYRHREQPNSTRCPKPGQLPMQTASRAAEHPGSPLTKEHLAPLQDVGYSHRSVVGSHLPSGRDNFRAHFNQTIPTPQQPGASVNTQEPRIASCPLKTSPWPAWLLGVSIQRRLDSQFPSSQAWPAWPWARHFTSLSNCL